MATFPVYIFDARTGALAVNVFGKRYLSVRQQREIEEITRGVRLDLAAGNIGPDDVRVGWSGGGWRPAAAVDVNDAAAMAGWLSRAHMTVVRVAYSEREAMTDADDGHILTHQEIAHARDD